MSRLVQQYLSARNNKIKQTEIIKGDFLDDLEIEHCWLQTIENESNMDLHIYTMDKWLSDNGWINGWPVEIQCCHFLFGAVVRWQHEMMDDILKQFDDKKQEVTLHVKLFHLHSQTEEAL